MSRRKITATISRDQRGDWTIEAGRFRATLPAAGPEVDAWVDAGKPTGVEAGQAPERVSKLAAKVVSRTRHKPAEPKNGHHPRHHLVPLDGEESVTMRPVAMKHKYHAADNHPTEWAVFCNSPRCAGSDLLTPDGTRAVALVRRDDYLDTGYSFEITENAEQAAYDARNDHIAWHRETYGVHPRVQLDWWLESNPGFGWAEPDRAELDRQLAIARSGA